MFFHFVAIVALLWKFLGLIGNISCPVPYSIREILETLFGVFAIMLHFQNWRVPPGTSLAQLSLRMMGLFRDHRT
jgi:hypothetical protein